MLSVNESVSRLKRLVREDLVVTLDCFWNPGMISMGKALDLDLEATACAEAQTQTSPQACSQDTGLLARAELARLLLQFLPWSEGFCLF